MIAKIISADKQVPIALLWISPSKTTFLMAAKRNSEVLEGERRKES